MPAIDADDGRRGAGGSPGCGPVARPGRQIWSCSSGPRKSRIYYLRKFFDYPITLTANTIRNLGLLRDSPGRSQLPRSRVHKIKPEKSLEDFLINRFGRELYLTFFKSYTEKVWGTPCDHISAEWGAQRIKGLSLTTAVKHFLRKPSRTSETAAATLRRRTPTPG